MAEGHCYQWGWSFIIAAALCLGSLGACETTNESTTAPSGGSYVHTRPSWSPDGKSIAFTAHINDLQGIYLVDTSGANLRLLLEGEGIGVAWSPDGEWLAFSRVGSLYKIRSNGDSLTRLTTSTQDIRPAWSRDGTRLAFVRTGIWMYEFSGGEIRQLSEVGNYPSWHPNDVEVIVLDSKLDALSTSVAYTFTAIHTVTGMVRAIHSFSTEADCDFTSVSPSGDAILYSLKPPNDYAQVWKYDLAGSTHTQLTDDGGDHPAWSPDGAMIIYTRTQAGDGGLWRMNADGTGKRRLTSP